MEEQEKAALNEDRKVNLVEVLVTEVTEEGKFYGCTMSEGPALEKLMDSLREEFTTTPPLAGAYQPKRNDICAAKFVDDQWYRAKIEKTGAADAQVLTSPGQVPVQSPGPKKGKRNLASGLVTKILWGTLPTPPTHNF